MSAPLLGRPRDTELLIMSVNVRRDLGVLAVRAADRWATRRDHVAAMLRAEQPTVLAVQESLPAQARAIRAALGPAYGSIGHGRRPGPRGEGCPVFYDRERLELLDGWQRALSDRPEVPGSIAWTSVLPRVVVGARFRDRRCGVEFTLLNTHLDAFSPWARRRQAAEVHAAAVAAGTPVVVTGDLNAAEGSAPWRALTADGVLRDTWRVADTRATPAWGTFAHYRAPRVGRRIDAILASAEVHVVRAGIDPRQHGGGWPSDHLPVQALVDLAPPAPGPLGEGA